MPIERLLDALELNLADLGAQGRRKGAETVIREIVPADGLRGPRYRLEGEGEKLFLKMNSNSYLGLSLHPALIEAEECAARAYGVGPGAVRFISGTLGPHVALERRLAAFHSRESAMILSSAYATVVSVIVPLVTPQTAIISDELNHNCIINAIRLSRPQERYVYKHLSMPELEAALERAASAGCARALVVTDGIFSMRGAHAPLAEILELARRYDARFPENVTVVVDDSHGVGAFGQTGRGTEEFTSARGDVLVGTLGKALGVNGGYVVGPKVLTDFLRETSMMYIYSNPITPAEASAASKSLEIIESSEGYSRLEHLRAMTARFRQGLTRLGFETLAGEHPIVPLMVRDTPRAARLVRFLRDHGILATGLNFPVVPKGDESIRFQVNADHTALDVDEVLGVLEVFRREA